jgi:hypothetical protein
MILMPRTSRPRPARSACLLGRHGPPSSPVSFDIHIAMNNEVSCGAEPPYCGRVPGITVRGRKKRMADPRIAENPPNALAAYRPPKSVRPNLAGEFAPGLSEVPVERQPGSQPKKLALRTKGKIILMDPAETVAIEAQGNSALLQTASRSYLLRQPISDLARRLEQYGFIRIHRSTVVNVAYIDEVRVLDTGEMLLRLSGMEREYSVSRSYRCALKEIASLWL